MQVDLEAQYPKYSLRLLTEEDRCVKYRKMEYFPGAKFSRFNLKNMRINICGF